MFSVLIMKCRQTMPSGTRFQILELGSTVLTVAKRRLIFNKNSNYSYKNNFIKKHKKRKNTIRILTKKLSEKMTAVIV